MKPNRLLSILALSLGFALALATIAQGDGPWYIAPGGNDTNDCLTSDSPCATISGAIEKAASGDTIIIATGIYTENLTINKDLTLQGAGSGTNFIRSVIDGYGSLTHQRVMTITSGSVVTITGMTITNGRTADGADGEPGGDSTPGGGIYNEGTLTLKNSAVISNSTGRGGDSSSGWGDGGNGGDGGGIYNEGTLTLDHSAVTGNTTGDGGGGSSGSSGGSGGGIYSINGTLIVTNSIVSGNTTGAGGGFGGRAGHGGGIANTGITTVTLSHSTVSGNTGGDGGGIHNTGDYMGQVTAVNNCTVSDNAADGGGGIHNGYMGQLMLTNSTVSGNSAGGGHGGGGILNAGYPTVDAMLTVANSTISDNSAAGDGGGISNYNGSQMILTNTTVADNTADSDGDGSGDGGGLYLGGDDPFAMTGNSISVKNTIIADNTDQGASHDCYCASDCSLYSQGYNLVKNVGNCTTITATGDITGLNPILISLTDNGGPTPTNALFPTSPAIDAGSCDGTIADQRGLPRPVDVTDLVNADDGCDIGAYEFQATVIVVFDVHLPLVLRNF